MMKMEKLIDWGKIILADEGVEKIRTEWAGSFNPTERIAYDAICFIEEIIEKLTESPEKEIEKEEIEKEELKKIIKVLEESNQTITAIRAALMDFGYKNIAEKLDKTDLSYNLYMLRRLVEHAESQKSS